MRCARALFPVSDGSWRSEELLERPAWLGRLARDRRRHDDRRIRQSDWRETGRDCRRCATRHPHHATVHVVLSLRLVLVACALVWTAIVLRLGDYDLHHRTRFSGHSRRNAARREGESRQKGEPEPAHADIILVRGREIVNGSHPRLRRINYAPCRHAVSGDAPPPRPMRSAGLYAVAATLTRSITLAVDRSGYPTVIRHTAELQINPNFRLWCKIAANQTLAFLLARVGASSPYPNGQLA